MTSIPQVLDVHFDYAGQTVYLELLQRVPMRFGIDCPICRAKLELDPRGVIVNLGTRLLTIRPNVHCPHRGCGWSATVVRGVATDLDVPPLAEPPGGVVVTSHTERARVCACGRRFSSKSHVRCRACREGAVVQSERRASARVRAK